MKRKLESKETKDVRDVKINHVTIAIAAKNAPLMSMIMDVFGIRGICTIVAEYARSFKGETVHCYEGHKGYVTDLIELPNDKIASCSADGTICIWDTATGLCLNVLDEHSDQVGVLALSGDCLASGSMDKTVKIWNIDTWVCTHTLLHDDWICSLVFIGGLLVSCTHNTLNVWDVEHEQIQTICTLDSLMTEIVYFNDALLTLADGAIVLRSSQTLSPLLTFETQGPDQPWNNHVYSAMAKIDNNQVLCGAIDGSIHLWDVRGEKKTRLKQFTTSESRITEMSIQKPNLVFVDYDDGWQRVFNIDNGEQVSEVHDENMNWILPLSNGLVVKTLVDEDAICLMV